MKLIVEEGKAGTVLPRVMRAALRLFVEKGINATTIKDIARAGGVSEGALYRHFKSKEDLAFHIFTTHLNDFTMRLAGIVGGGKTTTEKIRLYIKTCFMAYEEDKQLFDYLIISEHREFDKFPASHKHPGHVAIEMMEEGLRKGEIRRMDPVVAASLLLGGVIRLCVSRARGAIQGDLKSEIDPVAESLVRAVCK
ncbi:MAG TPA: TetR/AcrR family transcriptional regulator [Elusimicrobiota bacterium]|nr:TetR/AcrR family transcriptional regulator [Elusimicrobiota bacterium]